MSSNLLLIGANEATTQELVSLVEATLSTAVTYQKATLSNYKNYPMADFDLIVCFVNRYDEMVKQYGKEKVIAVEFVPPTDFFVDVSRIPAGESAVIFNNSASGANVMLKFLEKYKLTHITYKIIAYDECSGDETKEWLSKARYILGTDGYVSRGKALFEKYGHCLLPDVTIIPSPPRTATTESVSGLAKVITALNGEKILQSALVVSTKLADQTKEISLITQNASKSIEETANTIVLVNSKLETEVGNVKATNEMAQELTQAVENIGAITVAMKYIASETNLLALNATIEAARAGEHGRGFSVVANEVRKLSEQSNKSTDNIRTTILAVQQVVNKIVPALQRTVNEIIVTQEEIERISIAAKKESEAMDEITQKLDSIVAVSTSLGSAEH